MNEECETDANEPKCASCGEPFSRHLGLIALCKELQKAKAEISDLKDRVAIYRAERNVRNLYP